MEQSSAPDGQAARSGDLGDLPLDPDIEADKRRARGAGPGPGPFASERRSRWPRIHWTSVGAVAMGGLIGGTARYGIGLAWPAGDTAFPWATFLVNASGAFGLALLLVLVLEVLPPTTYVRPALGTGFFGAFTTFSSLAVGTDHLAAHGHVSVAMGYVAASLIGGLGAVALGIVVGRSIAVNRAQQWEA